MTEELKEQVRGYAESWEFSDTLKGIISESGDLELSKEEAETAYDYDGTIMGVEEVVPAAMGYSDNYWEEFHEYEPFKDIPNDAFKILFTWGVANFMRESAINYSALKGASAEADYAESGERRHTIDREYANRSDKPIYYDEILECIFDAYDEKVHSDTK